MRAKTTFGCCLMALATVHAGERDVQYGVSDLQVGGVNATAWSINEAGEVVGYGNEAGLGYRGFLVVDQGVLWAGTLPGHSQSLFVASNDLSVCAGFSGTIPENREAVTWTAGGGLFGLGTLGGDESAANSIDNQGRVVGWSDDASSVRRAFVWEAGRMKALADLGGVASEARWINNGGVIVGTSARPGSTAQYGVVWRNSVIQELPPVTGAVHLPYFIHDNGNIAGFARFADLFGRARGTIWRDGEVSLRLGTLADGTPVAPESISVATGVNMHDEVIGTSTVPTTPPTTHAFVYQRGIMRDLTDLVPEPWEVVNVGPGAINDRGQIGAVAVDGSGNRRAVLLTPLQAPCKGDINRDGAIDLLDASVVVESMGCEAELGMCEGDLTSDGRTDLADYAALQRLFGKECASS